MRTVKFDTPALIGIDLVDHVFELLFGRVLAETSHDLAELVGADGTGAVLVEEVENIAKGLDLFI